MDRSETNDNRTANQDQTRTTGDTTADPWTENRHQENQASPIDQFVSNHRGGM